MLKITLDNRVAELATDQTLGIEHGVGRVHGNLVLGSITNQTLGLVKGDVRRGGSVTLVVGNDLHTVILPHTHAGIGGTKIDTHGSSFNRHVYLFIYEQKVTK
jgi:hypothetical protein